MNISAVIVDDEYLAIKVIEEYAARTDKISITATFKNPIEALAYLKINKTDLIFLDIQMPYLTGFELLARIPEPPLVIITTARHDFAIKAFDLKILDYLVKPIPYERFKQAITRVIEQKELVAMLENQGINDASNDFLEIRSDYKTARIPYRKIDYIEGLSEYVKIYTAEKIYITLISLKELENKLNENEFVRIHKSFIVALHSIAEYTKHSVKLKNGKELPVGRVYKTNFVERMKNNRIL